VEYTRVLGSKGKGRVFGCGKDASKKSYGLNKSRRRETDKGSNQTHLMEKLQGKIKTCPKSSSKIRKVESK